MLDLRAIAIRAMKVSSAHCVVRRTYKDVRQKIGLTTWPQMMKMCFPQVPYEINKGEWFIEIGDSRIWLAGLDDSERREHILGFEFSTIFVNECSEITWENIQLLRTRLAEKNSLINRLLADCNPPSKKHWSYKAFILGVDPEDELREFDKDDWASMQMNPRHNMENLDSNYLAMLATLGERQRKRFLDGEFGEEEEGLLWKREYINDYRVSHAPKNFRRVIVAVDPSGSDNETSDECGIVVVGESADEQYYVLDDRSMIATPSRWAQEVSECYHEYMADCVVAEVNFGADMVEVVMRSEDKNINFKKVRASRSKWVRAEPMAALYERGIVHHVGHLIDLEDELCEFNPKKNKKSPGRLDAVVWALTHLSDGSSNIINPKILCGQEAPPKPMSERTFAEIADDDSLWT